jgi:hypothetical protein
VKRRALDVGDIVLIPAGKVCVPAKVLYRSNYFKDLVLLGLYAVAARLGEVPSEPLSRPAVLVYTSQQPALKGRWVLDGRQPLSEDERGRARRIVGGDVWLNDECLGPASEAEMKQLPRMQALGAALVEKKAASLAVKGAH